MPNYLTPEGAKKLQAELNQLLNVQRAKVVHEVAEAAAQGDRSENAEYIYCARSIAASASSPSGSTRPWS